MFNKVLIANRGAIACRIIRTLKQMQITSVAVYSDADRHSLHVQQADEALYIGESPASKSYLDYPRLLQLAQEHGVEAIHPGYGFLSENAAFVEACEAAGIAFIGPTAQQMRDFGLKHTARLLAEQNQIPMLPGTGLLDTVAIALQEAESIGYPVMLKSTAGGGGIGMQLCWDAGELAEAFHSVERLAKNNFSQGGIFLEKFVQQARHLEVQIFGDGQGEVVALGERDCSLQRRNQKVIEETPAPGISDAVRQQLLSSAVALGQAVSYRSAGTVEFIYDAQQESFYFLEVNTRLQVEHGVTEMVTGVDLVKWMVRQAAGELQLAEYQHQPRGWAMQARIYAEDANKNFQPSSGLLTEVVFPDNVRIDTWVETGAEVSAFYDPMLAKLIVHAEHREQAMAQLQDCLRNTRLYGIETNQAYLQQVLADELFNTAQHYTRYLDRFSYQANSIDVLQPGTQSMVQDWPGRVGYWDVGIPPSGPMDGLAFRMANRLVGNAEGEAGLELTISGPSLRFNCDTVIALTGARMKAMLNDQPVDYGHAIRVAAGSVLKLRTIEGSGSRTYLAIKGGLDVPDYMQSKATFTLGQFGGHGGRSLRVGDVLRLHGPAQLDDTCQAVAQLPEYGKHWDIGVMYGPHGAPDFFTPEDIDTFFATDWEVHYNSSRTGVRLIGPQPQWAREDGGEAGLHPSNIHDNAYAIGAVDFTGDMPVILGPDGPSLGGFVCPVTIVQAELWKMGQLSPGDTIRFHCIDYPQAQTLRRQQQVCLHSLKYEAPAFNNTCIAGEDVQPVLYTLSEIEHPVAVCYRQAGDDNLLVEYGPLVLDLNLRFRVHALMQAVAEKQIEGIIDLTPGIRSLQLHYDSGRLAQEDLLQLLLAIEAQLPAIEDMTVPSRIVHLPLSWDDPSTRLAIEKYMQSVRPDAPWCPSNIEFIRRINGLDDIEAVRDILFNASYLVMGLGDVYLGAPVATPLDPRHRLVTTKYNPARTWTPENAVGIGGAYLCVYGMEGPGGYQFVGRTVQMWNRYRQTRDFKDGKQWLLRFFDQLRFFEVDGDTLKQMREDFIYGKYELEVEETELRLGDYKDFLIQNQDSIAAFKQGQQAAFDAERQRWIESGQAHFEVQEHDDGLGSDNLFEIPPGCMAVSAPVTGSVWHIDVSVGQKVSPGDPLLVVEAMKMEIPIESDEVGVVREVLCQQGSAIHAGQALLIIELEAE